MPTTNDLHDKALRYDHERRSMCEEMHELIGQGSWGDALAIADALIPIYDVELHGLCNALWVVQNDNTGLPLDEKRARRYLAATLLRAWANPEMHLNACGVLMELGEPEAAMRQLLLAKKREVDLAPHLGEPLLADLKSHPRWSELVDGLRGPVEDVSWMEIVEDCIARNELNEAVPAILDRWRETHAPRLADLLDAIAQATGERSGYCAARIEEAIQNEPTELVSELDDGTRWRVAETDAGEEWLLYDLDDPRFSSALIPMLVAHPEQPSKKLVQQGWRALMHNVAAARDRRLVAPLRELSAWVEAKNPGIIGATMRQAFEEAARRIEEAPAPEEKLSTAEEEFLTRLESDLPRPPDRFHVEVEMPPAAVEPEQSDELLTFWRRTRSPRVAEVLSLREMRSPTLDLGSEVRALDPKLDLEDYDDVHGDEAAQLIWEKRHAGADPRVVEHLVQLLRDPPFIYPRTRENGVGDFWLELLDTLRSFEDVRALEPLRTFENGVHALCKEADAVAEEEMYTSTPIGGFLRHQAKGVVRHLASIVVDELVAEDAARVEELEAEYEPEGRARDDAQAAGVDREARERELLRAVLDDPDSDAARLAYAEHLEKQVDPHGELIRLQVKDENPTRQKELLEAHEGRFLGTLANIAKSAKFERGFVSEVRVDTFKLAKTNLGELPLQTIRCLHLDSMDWERYDEDTDDLAPDDALYAFVCHPNLRSLRHIEGVTPDALALLSERGCPNVEMLTFDVDRHTEVDWDAVHAALGTISALRCVCASTYSPDDFEATRPLFEGAPEQVEVIELGIRENARIMSWPGMLEMWWKSRFSEFAVRSPGVGVRFARDGDRISVRAEQRDEYVGPILGLIFRLPADSMHVFEYTVSKGVTGPTAVQLRVLESALGRYADLDFSLPAPSGEGRDIEAELRDGRISIEELCERVPDAFATQALGWLRAEEGVEVLVKVIRNDKHRGSKDAAFRALGRIGSEKAVAPLTEIVREAFGHLDEVDPKRFEGLDALGAIGAEESLPLFREALRDGGDTYDARAATAALALHGEPTDVELIERAIEREDEREAIRFHIPLFALDPARCDPEGAGRVVASFGDWWKTDLRERLARCLIRLAERLPAEQTEVRAIFTEGLRRQIRVWRTCALEDQLDRFSPDRACWLELVEQLAVAWGIDTTL